MTETIGSQIRAALEELYAVAKPEEGALLVVGCSTSEVIGKKIGTAGSAEVARAIYETVASFCAQQGLCLAAQCCEHLNRSLVVEREDARRLNLTRVNAIPQPTAGGAFATACWQGMKSPTLVENVCADLGIDIGNTLIGMHLRPVAVPVRVSVKTIGEAPLVLARTRPKYVGGERARYDPEIG